MGSGFKKPSCSHSGLRGWSWPCWDKGCPTSPCRISPVPVLPQSLLWIPGSWGSQVLGASWLHLAQRVAHLESFKMSLLCFPPSYLFRIPLPVHQGVSFTKHPFLFRSFSCSLSLQSDTRISGWVDQPQAISPVALPTPSTPLSGVSASCTAPLVSASARCLQPHLRPQLCFRPLGVVAERGFHRSPHCVTWLSFPWHIQLHILGHPVITSPLHFRGGFLQVAIFSLYMHTCVSDYSRAAAWGLCIHVSNWTPLLTPCLPTSCPLEHPSYLSEATVPSWPQLWMPHPTMLSSSWDNLSSETGMIKRMPKG